MGHTTQQPMGFATLDSFGGLITMMNSTDLPEGASPRNYDVDFVAGSVFTRAGLESVYSFASVLNISALTIYNDVGTFTFSGTTPSVNEGFILSGFPAQLSFLNGETVFVLSVNTLLGTFTAGLNTSSFGTFTGLSATATSAIGNFVGPNAPASAVDAPTGGEAWSNVSGILGDTSYSSVSSGSTSSDFGPTTAINNGSGSSSTPVWTNPGNAISGSSFATVVLSNASTVQSSSIAILANGFDFSDLPSDATVVGAEVTYQASCSYSASGSTSQGPNAGSSVNLTWTNPTNVYVQDGVYATYSVAPSGTSGILDVTGFGFSVPAGATVTGIQVQVWRKNLGGTGTLVDNTIQLLKAGTATGSNLASGASWNASAEETITYGGSSNLWGTTWTPSDINNTAFGLKLVASNSSGIGGANAGVDFISIKVFYTATASPSAGLLQVQLATNGAAVGDSISQVLTSSLANYQGGNSTYLWGLGSLTLDNTFGVLFTAQAGTYTASNASFSFDLNQAELVLFYTTSESDALRTTRYLFSVSESSGISGFGATFQAYSSSNTMVSLQLLKNGLPVGEARTQTLSALPTIYSLGSPTDLWGSTWSAADVNNTQWGIQVIASGEGTTFINDLDALIYITPSLTNFNFIGSFIENDQHISTLALDANGNLYQENLGNPFENEVGSPNVLSIAETSIFPNSFANGATEDDQFYLCLSNLNTGWDRPRVVSRNEVTDSLQFLPLSQCGPGAPPLFQASLGSGGGTDVLIVTAYSVSTGVITFTFNTATTPVVGALYTLAGTGNANIDGFTFSVLGTPSPTTTQFSAAALNATGSGSGLTATASPTYSYSISSITQPASAVFNGQILLWSAGPGQTAPGSTLTFYYAGVNQPENQGILNAFAAGNACIVYIKNAPVGNGTWQLTGHGIGIPPSETGNVPYFTVAYTSSSFQRYGGPSGSGPNGPGNTGTFQITLATMTTTSPIPDLTDGDQITITGSSPSSWNNSWSIIDSLTSGVLNITTTQMDNAGNATYGFTVQSGVGPVKGEIVSIQDATNAAVFNTIGVIASVTGSQFVISGFPGGSPIPQAAEANAQAITYGTQFTFDPGTTTIGTSATSPIFGNTTSSPGHIAVVGGSIQPIGSGTRQGVVYFITESGYETSPSSPVTFTVSEDANYILVSGIPIGPPNVIARGIAFTEAGQNGVPGANFYVIDEPVTVTASSTVTTYSSTIIRDNITTTAKFTFTDAVLLNSREIDIQGADLFNLIELGASAWCVPYASRMFYGLQLNKINNWTTGGGLTFNSGYNPNPGGNITPAGWTVQVPADIDLLESPSISGTMSLYIKNTYTGAPTTTVGMISQTAYQDPYKVAIIYPNTTYSVRVTCSNPGGVDTGNLVIDLTDYFVGIGFGTTYGTFALPLSEMSSTMAQFSGTLLTAPFTTSVSSALQIRVWLQNSTFGSDCLIDRVEVYPTAQPFLQTQVYGSYIDNLEAIDVSGSGGIIDTSTENSQPCMGGFVMRDELYLLKTGSLYSTQDNPNSEPGGWTLREVSNRVGAVGINSYDVGEEWLVTACRSGIYGFNGGQPTKIMQELWNLWELINWNAGNTIVLRNDIVNRRLYCAVPLPTGTSPAGVATKTVQWLPNAPYNPAPTSPNVILMLNYQGLNSFEELINGAGVHTTMFGMLAAVDMKRKWSIWQVPTPYLGWVTRENISNVALFVCNGINSSKIYQFDEDQLSDDGAAINSLYTTYGFVNATKAATLPIFGFHNKRYQSFQVTADGSGAMSCTLYPNILTAKYPYTIPGVPGSLNLTEDVQTDWFRPLNLKGNRMFIEFSTNSVDAWMNVSKLILGAVQDPWSSVAPTGGGNVGISSGTQN